MTNLFEGMLKEIQIIAYTSKETGILTKNQENLIEELHTRAETIGNHMLETTKDAEMSAGACINTCSTVEHIAIHINEITTYTNKIHNLIHELTIHT